MVRLYADWFCLENQIINFNYTRQKFLHQDRRASEPHEPRLIDRSFYRLNDCVDVEGIDRKAIYDLYFVPQIKQIRLCFQGHLSMAPNATTVTSAPSDRTYERSIGRKMSVAFGFSEITNSAY